MKQTFETNKSVDQVVEDIQKVLPNYGFGLQHIHNPPEKMREKGIDFKTECKILDICSPIIANEILSYDISLSCIMPCKISVYDDKGQTTIALNSIVQLVDDLNPDLTDSAQEVQDTIINIINDSR